MKNNERNKIFILIKLQTLSRDYQIPYQIDSIQVHQQIRHLQFQLNIKHG